MDLQAALDAIKAYVASIEADPAKLQDTLTKGIMAIDQARTFYASLASVPVTGDRSFVDQQIAQWADIVQTQKARADLKDLNDKGASLMSEAESALSAIATGAKIAAAVLPFLAPIL